jgi:hypothetical protein
MKSVAGFEIRIRNETGNLELVIETVNQKLDPGTRELGTLQRSDCLFFELKVFCGIDIFAYFQGYKLQ